MKKGEEKEWLFCPCCMELKDPEIHMVKVGDSCSECGEDSEWILILMTVLEI